MQTELPVLIASNCEELASSRQDQGVSATTAYRLDQYVKTEAFGHANVPRAVMCHWVLPVAELAAEVAALGEILSVTINNFFKVFVVISNYRLNLEFTTLFRNSI